MRPDKSFTVDILFQDSFFEHEAKIVLGAAHGRVGAFINDMA